MYGLLPSPLHHHGKLRWGDSGMEPEQGEGNGAVPFFSKTSTCHSVSLQTSFGLAFHITNLPIQLLIDRRQHKLRTQRLGLCTPHPPMTMYAQLCIVIEVNSICLRLAGSLFIACSPNTLTPSQAIFTHIHQQPLTTSKQKAILLSHPISLVRVCAPFYDVI